MLCLTSNKTINILQAFSLQIACHFVAAHVFPGRPCRCIPGCLMVPADNCNLLL